MILYLERVSLTVLIILICYTNCAKITNNKYDNKYECGNRKVRKARIIGGDDTYRGEFPWIASIFTNGKHYCGGVLISKRWILTAAHCVIGHIPENFIIRLGSYQIQSNCEHTAIDIPVSEIIIHDNYSYPHPFSNDIAVLRLNYEVEYTDYIVPICLPLENDSSVGDLYENQNGTVIGWGLIHDNEDSEETNADVLQKVILPIVSNKLCESWYRSRGKIIIISSNQFCAGYKHGGKDACQGDSGGPILLHNLNNDTFKIIGIVSAGIGCALPELPGLYTRVDSFIPWISKYTQQ